MYSIHLPQALRSWRPHRPPAWTGSLFKKSLKEFGEGVRQGENIPRIFSWGAHGGGIFLPDLCFIYSFNKHRFSARAKDNAIEGEDPHSFSAYCMRGKGARMATPPPELFRLAEETSSFPGM